MSDGKNILTISIRKKKKSIVFLTAGVARSANGILILSPKPRPLPPPAPRRPATRESYPSPRDSNILSRSPEEEFCPFWLARLQSDTSPKPGPTYPGIRDQMRLPSSPLGATAAHPGSAKPKPTGFMGSRQLAPEGRYRRNPGPANRREELVLAGSASDR